jgi:uncharacterized protein (DUF302 family)
MRSLILSAGFAMVAATASADLVTYTTDDPFDDVAFAVESAIVSQGLVIDAVSHVGEMLERTKADVGGGSTIFVNADIFQFCSAVVSRAVMEADPDNIRFCPYPIYVWERADTPGTVTVAHQAYPEGPMQQVEALLRSIVSEAMALE